MQWFKHDTTANQDARLQNVLLDYGLEGYGLYWYCMELIAGKVSIENLTFELEHDARVIARNVGSTAQKVEEMMRHFVELGLFENVSGRITCHKLAKRLDKSMTSNAKMRSMISKVREKKPDDVMMIPDSVMMIPDSVMMKPDSVMQEENRIDKNRKETTSSSKPDLCHEIFDYWVSVMGKDQAKTKPTAKRLRLITARLNDGYTEQDIKTAILNCSKSDFHMGKNDRNTMYNDLELICRSGEKLEAFRDSVRQSKGVASGIAEWLNRDEGADYGQIG